MTRSKISRIPRPGTSRLLPDSRQRLRQAQQTGTHCPRLRLSGSAGF